MERRIGTIQGWREGWVQIKELKRRIGTDQG